jgi:hypothetical protein
MRREDEYLAIRRWEGAAAEQAARRSDLAKQLGQPIEAAPVALSNEQVAELVLRMLSDPVGGKKAVDEVMAATTAHNAAAHKADQAVDESHKVLAAHDKKMKADKAAHDKQCEADRAAIAELQAKNHDKSNELQAGLAEVERLKADYGRRIAKIKEAGMD